MAKKATKAELLQTWSQPDRTWETIPASLIDGIQQPQWNVYLDRTQGLVYHPTPSGLLEPWADCSAPLQASPHARFCKSGGHVTAYRLDIRSNSKTRSRSEPWRAESTLTLLWDSEGQLPCPFPIEIDGKCVRFDLLPQGDGGVLGYIMGVGNAPRGQINELIRYAPSGQTVWRKELGFAYPLFSANGIWLKQLSRAGGQDVLQCTWLDPDGTEQASCQLTGPYRKCVTCPERSDTLWAVFENQYPTCDLIRIEPSGGEAARVQLDGWVTVLYPVGDKLLRLGGGATLLERDTLQVLAALPGKQEGHFLGQDRWGRLWLEFRGMVECYDQNLKELSRHRLKGSVMGSHLDGEGIVCIVTYQAKEELVRVYRLS